MRKLRVRGEHAKILYENFIRLAKISAGSFMPPARIFTRRCSLRIDAAAGAG